MANDEGFLSHSGSMVLLLEFYILCHILANRVLSLSLATWKQHRSFQFVIARITKPKCGEENETQVRK